MLPHGVPRPCLEYDRRPDRSAPRPTSGGDDRHVPPAVGSPGHPFPTLTNIKNTLSRRSGRALARLILFEGREPTFGEPTTWVVTFGAVASPDPHREHPAWETTDRFPRYDVFTTVCVLV